MFMRKWLVLYMVLTVVLMFGVIAIPSLSGLYYFRNPLDILFRAGMVDVEAFHIPLAPDAAYQGVLGSLRLHLGPASLGGSVVYSADNLVGDFSKGNISLFAGGALELGGLVVGAAMPLNYAAGSVDLTGTRMNIAVGFGGVKRARIWRYGNRFVKIGGSAIYYNHRGLAGFDESGQFVINKDPDWLNARVGIIADVRSYKGTSLFDLSFDLNFFKDTDEKKNPLKYIYATLAVASRPLVLGATYAGESGYSFSAGLAFGRMLKAWGMFKFDKQFNYLGWGAFAQVSF